MEACRAGWSPMNIQASHPSTTRSEGLTLLGRPPHAVPHLLQQPRCLSLRRDSAPDSVFGVGWPSHTISEARTRRSMSRIPSPARVTGGRCTAQLTEIAPNGVHDPCVPRCSKRSMRVRVMMRSNRPLLKCIHMVTTRAAAALF